MSTLRSGFGAGRRAILRPVCTGAALCVVFALIGLCATPTFGAPAQTAPAEQKKEPHDALGRDTPRGTVVGFLSAAAKQNFALAASYLNLSQIPLSRRKLSGEELARQLKVILDRGTSPSQMTLSKKRTGELKDGLAPNEEKVGVIHAGDQTSDIILTRVDTKNGKIWLFSPGFVSQIPKLSTQFSHHRLESLLPEMLVNVRFLDVALWQWIAMALLFAAAFPFSRLLARSIVYAITLMIPAAREGEFKRILDIAAGFFGVVLTVTGLLVAFPLLGVPLLARGYLTSAAHLLILASITWFLLRMLDVSAEILMGSLLRRGRNAALSIIPLGRRISKVLLIALALLVGFSELGFNVTAGLAAVGIGGVAVALAAQKTLENFFGTVALIADEHVNVGDLCRVGDTFGTVEDIGMRSTRIRTYERTLVSVPNAEFSSTRLENFGKRDRFWFRPAIGLRYETTPDQIRFLLVEIRSVLYSHPKVHPDPARVRFVGFGEHSLNIEIFAYVNAIDHGEFLEISEDLLLRIMDVVAESGTGFAFPSQTLYLATDSGVDRKKGQQAHGRVEEWRRNQQMQLPAFTAERIAALSGSIEYPPPGSANHSSRT